jgi:hypothetical protein
VKGLFIVFISIFLSGNFCIAQKYTIYGYVKDSASGETLIGASIELKESGHSVITNNYGFYSITLPQGLYTLSCTYMGYKLQMLKINLNSNTIIDVPLASRPTVLDEVIVSSGKSNVANNLTSQNHLETDRIKSMNSGIGEPDLLKSLQLIPGIQTSAEGSSNLSIRGGSYDQNLILLDEAPVYNASHALGFFSTFNVDAIKSVNIYKGAFPAQYGGRLSSVIDVVMKDGNNQNYQVDGGVGILDSKLGIEGPLIKNKASFIFSSRYCYAGQMLNLLAGKIGSQLLNIYPLRNFNDNNKLNFYDLNLKVNIQTDPTDHFYLSAYTGHDLFYSYPLDNENSLEWGNITGTLRWNHIFGNKIFSNLTYYYSNYNYAYSIIEDIRNFIWKSNIKETGLKLDLSAYLNQQFNLKFGTFFSYHFFSPGEIDPLNSSSIIKSFSLDKKDALEFGFYINNDQNLSRKFILNYGLRYSAFANLGPGTVYKYNGDMTVITDSTFYKSGRIIHVYQGLEPRISLKYLINDVSSFKFAYSYTIQYLHLLNNSTVGLPTDTWMPPDNYIKPETSHQYVLGYYRTLNNDSWELTVEAYYKTLKNIIDYKDNADLFMNTHVETLVLSGSGNSFGIEYMLEKRTGKLSGWLSYTLAKTNYTINGINNNHAFPPRFDIRHNISLTGSYILSRYWSLSSTFKLTSGGFITIPEGTYENNGASFYYYTSRNGYELPAYHRLDLSATYSSPKNDKRKWKSEWIFSIYNVYNHKNIYSLYVRQDSNTDSSNAYIMYLYGVLPTISYNFKF